MFKKLPSDSFKRLGVQCLISSFLNMMIVCNIPGKANRDDRDGGSETCGATTGTGKRNKLMTPVLLFLYDLNFADQE